MSEYTLRNSDGDQVGTIKLAVFSDAEISDLIDLLEHAVSARLVAEKEAELWT